MNRNIRIALTAIAIPMTALLSGCDGMNAMFPNGDPALRKASVAFAKDASLRHYEAEAPVVATGGGARAHYELINRQVDLTNITDQDWTDVEVWINRQYVVHLPAVEGHTDKTLKFRMFYDDKGNAFDTKGGAQPIRTIEICRDGKIFSVPTRLAD